MGPPPKVGPLKPAPGPLAVGPVALVAALALAVADLRRLRFTLRPFRIQHA